MAIQGVFLHPPIIAWKRGNFDRVAQLSADSDSSSRDRRIAAIKAKLPLA
ncbi:hypothetical protein DAPPUDRAFT_233690 [Daphnia pulex]|uniref:Uncharacterized protein n=1 Tax=Daphnia pulex TaxID=6669 RepID=E9FVG6_DAPPU|nr:hypothetical protein DAPPUDRAFT_233690 [Daphnia pulex]|eukprot:EFX89109.1 hypothetical protein DAPPUDRAFT_233690 [Daphnia pulex]